MIILQARVAEVQREDHAADGVKAAAEATANDASSEDARFQAAYAEVLKSSGRPIK